MGWNLHGIRYLNSPITFYYLLYNLLTDYFFLLWLLLPLPLVGPSSQVAKNADPTSSSDVVVISGNISSHFLVPSIGDALINLHLDPKDFLPLSSPAVTPLPSIDPQSIIATALQGLSPAQVKNLLSDTIQSVFLNAITSLKPSILEAVKPEILNVPARRSYADSVIPKLAIIICTAPASVVPSVPAASVTPMSANAPALMVVDEDGF